MSKTISELKALHESGAKVYTSTQARINKQLARVCGYRECDVSLAFRRGQMEFCSHNHAALERYRIKRINRLKKQRFNERHGLTRKALKRTLKPSKLAHEAVDYELIYENYKEPLKPIKKVDGFGYYGTIATTADKQVIQCHLCGKLFGGLNTHVRSHNISVVDYKERYKLNATTALVADSTRQKLQKQAVKIYDGKLPDHLKEYNRKVQSGEIQHKAHGKKMTLEQRNKKGWCPDQMLEKIKELAAELGRAPSSDEFRSYYGGRYVGSIRYQFGSYLNAVKKAKLVSMEELRHPDKEKLLADLIDFHKTNGRIPMTSDFNRGLLRDRGVYIRQFGTLNNARIEAGLDAVIPMPFGQIVLLKPEQYLRYKAGLPIDKIKQTEEVAYA